MFETVLMAIVWLHPAMERDPVTRTIAGAIVREAARHELDPLLVVAKISAESRFSRRARSRTNDWGLMQIHVSRTTYPKYRGREKTLLTDVRLNIRLGVRLLGFWKRYHDKHCRPGDHLWWIHYQHGRRVIKKGRAAGAGRRVLKIYQKLVNRFYLGAHAKTETETEETAILAARGL
jgi:soluble lytic murein transglycosylase